MKDISSFVPQDIPRDLKEEPKGNLIMSAYFFLPHKWIDLFESKMRSYEDGREWSDFLYVQDLETLNLEILYTQNIYTTRNT